MTAPAKFRSRKRRAARYAVLAASLAVACGVAWYLAGMLPIGTGLAAKVVCSGVFVSGRAPDAVVAEDLRPYGVALLDLVEVRADREARTVSAAWQGLAPRTAMFRDGLGCTLAIGKSVTELRMEAAMPPRAIAARKWPRWPEGDAPADLLEPGHPLGRVLDAAFAESDPARPRSTRAVVVVRDGQLVAEQYAPGFGAEMPMPGWSLAKSAVNALVGVLVHAGRLDPDAPIGAWAPDDPRAAISTMHLLQMTSGLAFDERYANPRSDVSRMLFASADAAEVAKARPLEAAPGTRWAYASGTTNLLMSAIRSRFANRGEYFAFPRMLLFDRLGMASAIMEPDASGTFVGSSFMYATARDWARLGLLFANDGVWNGERVLPAGWVARTRTPAPADPDARYGAHWWLKLDANVGHGAPPPRLPPDAFHAAGHGGQFITVIPSKRVVVVRLGHALERGAWDQDAFAADVLAALERI